MADEEPWGKNVLVEFADRIAWVTINRPEKRNAMSPALNDEMVKVLEALESTSAAACSCSPARAIRSPAGMDLQGIFPRHRRPVLREQLNGRRSANAQWQWRQLMAYPQADHRHGQRLVLRRRIHAADRLRSRHRRRGSRYSACRRSTGASSPAATSPAVVATMSQRDALYYVMTGETFDGKQAARCGLVNEAVPRDRAARAHARAGARRC